MTLESRRSSAGRGIALTVLANFGTLAIGLFTSVILARSLGPEGRGAYAAILTWPSVIAILGIFGLNQAAVFWSAREPGQVRRIVSSGSALALVVLAPVLVAAWLLMPVLLRAQAPRTVEAARYFTVLFGVANALWLVAIGALQGLRLFGSWNRLRVGQAVLWLAALSFAVTFSRADPLVLSVLYALSFLLVVPWALFVLRGVSSGPSAPSIGLAGSLVRYGLAGWSGTVPIYLNRRMDQLAMAALVDPRVLGMYAVASTMSVLISTVIASVANVAMPHVASTTDPTAQLHSTRRYIHFSVVVGILCGGGMMVVTPFLIPVVFGASFIPAILPAIILIPVSALQGVATVTEDILFGLDRARSVARAEGVGVLVTAAGLAFTLPRQPLVGAPLTLLVAYSVVLYLALRACREHLGGSIGELLIPTRADWRDAIAVGRRYLPSRRP